MVLSVVSDVTALAASQRLGRTNDAMVTSLRRLSSGYRISQASDDAAGLGISEGLRSQIRGMTVAVRNTQDGISVLQIADGALGDIDDLLHRMRDLSVQAANQGALTPQSTAMIQKEIDQLKHQLDQIAGSTAFDGTTLLDGNYSRVFQVGANAGETLAVTIGGRGHGMSTKDLGLDSVDVTAAVDIPATEQPAVSAQEGTPAAGTLTLAGDYVTPGSYETAFRALGGTVTYGGRTFDLGSVDYSGAVTATDYLQKLDDAAVAALGTTSFIPFVGSTTGLMFTGETPGPASTKADAEAMSPTYTAKSGAEAALPMLDDAITRVTSLRSELGAVTNRFQRTVDRLNGSIRDTTASESRIRDTDMASEMVTFSRAQILMQAGTAMLAQAGSSEKLLLEILS